jgi:hypothetical protein
MHEEVGSGTHALTETAVLTTGPLPRRSADHPISGATMKFRTNRILPLALVGALSFGLAACEVEDGDPDTAVIEDDDDADAEGDDTVIEEGDDTDVDVEDDTDAEGGDSTDTSTESDTSTDTSTETDG